MFNDDFETWLFLPKSIINKDPHVMVHFKDLFFVLVSKYSFGATN